MSVLDALVATPPRDSGGAIAENRRAYQAAWAILEMLERLAGPGRYLFVFEYHEDVLVGDDDDAPTVIDCYQVKTTKADRRWTCAKLTEIDRGVPSAAATKKPTKGKKGKEEAAPDAMDLPTQLTLEGTDVGAATDPSAGAGLSPQPRSVLGRLLDSGRRLGSMVRSLNLVTNREFELQLRADPPSAQRRAICGTDFHDDTVADLAKRLAKELGQAPQAFDNLHLRLSILSVDDPEAHAKGILLDSLLKRLNVEPNLTVAIYQTLRSEVTRRSSDEKMPETASALAERRAISRKMVETVVAEARRRPQLKASWERVRQDLQSMGVKPLAIAGMRDAWLHIAGARLDTENRAIDNAFADVAEALEVIIGQEVDASFDELSERVSIAVARKPWRSAYTDLQLKALTMVVLDERQELPPTDPQPSKEAT